MRTYVIHYTDNTGKKQIHKLDAKDMWNAKYLATIKLDINLKQIISVL
jgi:hypothetical protein